jgi:hypothetical protein
MQVVFVPVDGLEYHRDRDCEAIRDVRVDFVSTWSPRAHLFDPCSRCAPDAAPRPALPVSLRTVEEMPAPVFDSMRAEAIRRHVNVLDWLARQPVPVRGTRPNVSRRNAYTSASSFHAS